MDIKMTIKECKSHSINRIEDSKEYKEAIYKSNEKISNYKLQQVYMYQKAKLFYVI